MGESVYYESSAINICVKGVVKKLRQESEKEVRVKILDVKYIPDEKVWEIRGVGYIISVMGIDSVGRHNFVCRVNDLTGEIIGIEYR